MSATRSFVPDLLLEQYALGELKESERAMIGARLASDPSLRSRLAELKASDEAILAEAKPAEIAAAIRRRLLSPADDRVALGLGAAGRDAGETRFGRAGAGPAAWSAKGRLRSFRPVSAFSCPQPRPFSSWSGR